MDTRKLLRVALPLMAAVAAGIGWLMMDKPHRDVAVEVARHQMVPEELRWSSRKAAGGCGRLPQCRGRIVWSGGGRQWGAGGPAKAASWRHGTRPATTVCSKKGSSSNSRAGLPVMMTCSKKSDGRPRSVRFTAMKHLQFLILCALLGAAAPITAQQTMAPYTFEWEVVAVDSIPGMTTARLYAVLNHPDDYLTSVSGWDTWWATSRPRLLSTRTTMAG